MCLTQKKITNTYLGEIKNNIYTRCKGCSNPEKKFNLKKNIDWIDKETIQEARKRVLELENFMQKNFKKIQTIQKNNPKDNPKNHISHYVHTPVKNNKQKHNK